MMAGDAEASAPTDASPVASVATLVSAAAITLGLAGQAAVAGSVLFPMLTGFGFAMLAANVLAHQRVGRKSAAPSAITGWLSFRAGRTREC